MIMVLNSGNKHTRLITGNAGDAEIHDPLTLPPTMQGPKGKAWGVDIKEAVRKFGKDPAKDGCVGCWLVEAPWAHPIWHSYIICLVHLRQIEGSQPPLMYLSCATHEFWVYVLDPEVTPRKAIIEGDANWFKYRLTPCNFGAQIVENTDDLARERLVAAVQDICDGKLSPDTDFMHSWVERFGDNMIKARYR